MILAGIPYNIKGRTVELLRPMRNGDFIAASAFLIDGETPEVGSLVDNAVRELLSPRRGE